MKPAVATHTYTYACKTLPGLTMLPRIATPIFSSKQTFSTVAGCCNGQAKSKQALLSKHGKLVLISQHELSNIMLQLQL